MCYHVVAYCWVFLEVTAFAFSNSEPVGSQLNYNNSWQNKYARKSFYRKIFPKNNEHLARCIFHSSKLRHRLWKIQLQNIILENRDRTCNPIIIIMLFITSTLAIKLWNFFLSPFCKLSALSIYLLFLQYISWIFSMFLWLNFFDDICRYYVQCIQTIEGTDVH